ncbi:MAG: FixH family protein [Rhodospirillales bacterium]|nr:FixH family protein [Alphaproteobacteria bacterium]USO03793.1 MAG: FixH family protein [Rhodospirillales bacterium]
MSASTPRKSDKWIPWYFVLVFLVVVCVNGFFVYTAVTTHTGLVTKSPYEKGLSYNKKIAEARRQENLSLKQDVSFEAGRLRWQLRDKQGRPILKVKANARFVRPVQEGYDFSLPLQEKGSGLYEAVVDFPLSGKWTARLDAQWDSQHYQTLYHLMAP